MDVSSPTQRDADAVVALWVDLADSQRDHGSHVLADENRETVRETVHRRIVADELLVARDSDELVGFVTFEVETGAYRQDVTRGVVENLYVAPPHRDGGVGTALLDAAEDRLADGGADVVALEVLAGNADARRFYRRHGYDEHRLELEKPLESDTP